MRRDESLKFEVTGGIRRGRGVPTKLLFGNCFYYEYLAKSYTY